MSEPTSVGGALGAGGGTAGAVAEGPAGKKGGRPERHSYWAVVGHAYWRRALNRIATGWLLWIIFLTIFVPFVANDAPLTAVIEGHREYPLIRNLTRVDWAWLIWGFVAAAFAVVIWRSGRRPLELEQLRSVRMKWLALLAGLGVVLTVGVVAFKADYLDSRDYHVMAANGELKEAVFAPLRWSYAEQESKVYSKPGEELANGAINHPTGMMQSAFNVIARIVNVTLHAEHRLGTDSVGRDVLSRLLWGARVVLEIGLVSEIISVIIGVIYGALMGYFVGKVDILGMRVLEIVEAIPVLFLLITFVAIFGRQLFMIMVIIGITGWTGIARFVRAEFLRIRGMDYVSAAKAMGLPLQNILFRHMLPNGLTPVIVTFTFGVAGNIVSESILSFLGIGVEPPIASWGSMLEQAGNPGVQFRWWLALPPGVMIFLTVFAFNIMGEGLRDAIDPKTNKTE